MRGVSPFGRSTVDSNGHGNTYLNMVVDLIEDGLVRTIRGRMAPDSFELRLTQLGREAVAEISETDDTTEALHE